MSSSSDAAHAEGLRLMTNVQKITATAEDRRKLLDHLITLCSYPSHTCKALFGTLVHKYFGEFEDLQDRAVDAILDLCEDEDEKVRKIGIKALGTTAKADLRWVRGNTGVLLQLLECPPSELELVHQALFTLISVSPQDVFAVMADDCKGSEEETGASRRNILDFLLQNCKDQRRTILESGDEEYKSAEEAFKVGFQGVMETTAIAETRIILNLLFPLSTISGRNATKDSAGEFGRLLTDSLHPTSSPALTIPLVRIFNEFTRRNPPLNPRERMRFLSRHGAAVVMMACEKGDAVGKELVRKIQEKWVVEAVSEWNKGSAEGDLREDKLVTEFCRTMIGSITDLHKRSKSILGSAAVTSETVFLSVYTLLSSLKDRRRDIIKGPESNSLLDLSRDISATLKSAKSSDILCLENIRRITEILADSNQSVEAITPSWKPLPARVAPLTKPAPSEPKADRPRPTTPDLPPGSSTSQSAVTPLDRPESVSQSTPKAQENPTSLASRLTAPPRTSTPLQSQNQSSAGPSNGRITGRTSIELAPSAPASTNKAGQELFPEKIYSNGSNGQKSSTLPPPSASAVPLAERIRPASGKRQREGDGPIAGQSGSEEPKLSLFSRMGSHTEDRDYKKPRASLPESRGENATEDQFPGAGISPLQRLSGGSRVLSPGDTLHQSTSSTSSAPSGGMSTKRNPLAPTANTNTASPSLSIFGRAATPTTTSGFSIKNRSTPSTPVDSPRELTIKSSAPAYVDEEEGVVRKGRGFQKTDNDGDFIMPQVPIARPVESNGHGDSGGFGRGGGHGFGFGAQRGLRRPTGSKGKKW